MPISALDLSVTLSGFGPAARNHPLRAFRPDVGQEANLNRSYRSARVAQWLDERWAPQRFDVVSAESEACVERMRAPSVLKMRHTDVEPRCVSVDREHRTWVDAFSARRCISSLYERAENATGCSAGSAGSAEPRVNAPQPGRDPSTRLEMRQRRSATAPMRLSDLRQPRLRAADSVVFARPL